MESQQKDQPKQEEKIIDPTAKDLWAFAAKK
jgi:hypothetical protein